MADENKIKFHYLKSNFFRVIHADGAIGGITPDGDIFFSIYNQRLPIPNLTVQTLSDAGELGPEIMSEREIRDGVVREIDVGVTISVQAASHLRDWLTEKIKLVQQVEEQQKKALQNQEKQNEPTNAI